jgi:hypothetical protein
MIFKEVWISLRKYQVVLRRCKKIFRTDGVKFINLTTKRMLKLLTSTQLRATWHTDSLELVVLPSTGASRFHNRCLDGGTSLEYFGCPLVQFEACMDLLESCCTRSPVRHWLSYRSHLLFKMSDIIANKEFWREFIQLYRSLLELWKVKRDVHKNHDLKDAGYDELFWTSWPLYQAFLIRWKMSNKCSRVLSAVFIVLIISPTCFGFQMPSWGG